MSPSSPPAQDELAFLGQLASATSRRKFLQWAGVTIGVAAIAGCSSDNTTTPPGGTTTVNLGSGDIGILNYAYALEQLEAAFYIKVSSSFYTGITAAETTILNDIMAHEVIHRDFLKAALGSNAIPALSVTFASIDFTSRASVLGAAKAFEDLGVSAYNGAGHLIVSADYLTLAGKIVSVEARHAAAIRDLLSPLSASFAGDDIVDPVSGLGAVNFPSTVLSTSGAGAYVTTKITYSNLPGGGTS